jgi:hypothetical protein
MATIPDRPKIYHITHVRNLPRILTEAGLWSDAKRLELGLDCAIVGMSEIKRRRLEDLEVGCHPGTRVGHYVPFYFCPRSIMLYILHRGNHPELEYRGGQTPIIHLQADLHEVVMNANRHGLRWAFSNSNAGARYTNFFASLEQLEQVDWAAVRASDFRDSRIKDGKQAEFLVFDYFPWTWVEKVGVTNQTVLEQVKSTLAGATHNPPASCEPGWYF